MKHLPALDGMRAIAVLSVIGSHVVTPYIPGSFGVTLFFFISGFIITRMLLENRGSLSAFYIRRFFRLYPALVAYIAASIVSMHFSSETLRWDGVAAGLLFYTNYYPETSGYFTHLWSLAVEEHFYIVFPLLAIFLRRKGLLVALICCLAFALCMRVYGYHAGLAQGYIQGATHMRIDSIAYGCLVSVLFHNADKMAGIASVLGHLSTRYGIFISFILLVLTFAIRSEEFRQTLRYTLQGMSFALMFCGIFYRRSLPNIFFRLLESKKFGYIGSISYSLYLFHELGRMIAFRLGFTQFSFDNIAVTFAITIPLALLSFYAIEQPCRRFGAALAFRSTKLPMLT